VFQYQLCIMQAAHKHYKVTFMTVGVEVLHT